MKKIVLYISNKNADLAEKIIVSALDAGDIPFYSMGQEESDMVFCLGGLTHLKPKSHLKPIRE